MNPPHSRPETIIIGASSTLSICISTAVVSATCGSLAIWSWSEASKTFGMSPAAHVADHDIDADDVQLLADAFLVAPSHADQGHDGGDADGDADEGQAGADGTPDQAAHDDGEKSH